MKRHLQRNRYRLGDHEREEIWRVLAEGAPSSGRTGSRPRLVTSSRLALATAAVACFMVWWAQSRLTSPPAEPSALPNMEIAARTAQQSPVPLGNRDVVREPSDTGENGPDAAAAPTTEAVVPSADASVEATIDATEEPVAPAIRPQPESAPPDPASAPALGPQASSRVVVVPPGDVTLFFNSAGCFPANFTD